MPRTLCRATCSQWSTLGCELAGRQTWETGETGETGEKGDHADCRDSTAGPNDLRAYSSLPRYDPSGPDPPPPEPYLTVRLSNRLHRQEESEDSASDSPAGEEADGLIANAAQHSNSGASDGSPGSSSSAGAGAGSGAGSGSSTPSASAQPVVHYPPSYAALAAVAHGNGNGGSQTHNSMPPIAMHRTHYGWSFTMPLGHDNVELATIHEDPDYPDYPDYPSIDSVNFSQMFI